MRNQILVYGAGGAAKDIIRLIEQTDQWKIAGLIVDGAISEQTILGYPIIGDFQSVLQFSKIGVVIANGDPSGKRIMVQKLEVYDHVSYPNIIHPSVTVHKSNILAEGIVIEEGAIITTNVQLGRFVSINIGATISHDCTVEDFVTISPKAAIAGNVHIEKNVFVGINSTIIERTILGGNAYIAAGAVVVGNVRPNTLVAGVPAEFIKDI